MAIARINEPVIGAFVVHIDGDSRLIKCASREEAEHIISCVEYVEVLVERRTKRTIRNAFGLHDWGGGVTVKDY